MQEYRGAMGHRTPPQLNVRPREVTNAFKLISLKRGGAGAPSNMQWQMIEHARAKDKWE
jgi:hypothetical protein